MVTFFLYSVPVEALIFFLSHPTLYPSIFTLLHINTIIGKWTDRELHYYSKNSESHTPALPSNGTGIPTSQSLCWTDI